VRIKREIGRGAMGVVYLGHDRVLGRDVALKALVSIGSVSGREEASSSASSSAAAAFLREARAAAAVKHANLTQIHHADVAPDGTPFLVMEYVDGPSLAQLLRQSGPMKPAVVLSVLADVCAAVEELHERDVVHRDLKPSNVLVDVGGEVYVTDFGLAVKRSSHSGTTGEALVAGTPLYMAPEMFEGQVSPRSDIYALGVMAFEMLCGHVPFSGSLEEVRRKHAEEPLPIDALRAKGVPEELIDLIERATHKQAMFRHKTARELSRAVQQIAKSIEGTASAKFELRRMIIQQGDPSGHVEPPLSIATAPTAANSTSYMETLSHIAAAKREKRMRLLDPTSGTAPGTYGTPEPVVDLPLQADVACAQCGYNLRGLAGSGKCPECGRAIRDSLFRDRLIFADEQWLRVVTAGVTTIAWGVAAVTVLYLFLGPFMFLVMSIAGRGDSIGYALAVANFLLAPLFAAVFLGGVFAVTAREPVQPSGTQPTVLRWLLRGAAAVACILTALTSLPRGPEWFMNPGVRPLFEIPVFATMGGVLLYLAWLVGRVPDVKLANQARRRGRFVFGVGFALVVLEMVAWFGKTGSLPLVLVRLPSLLLLALVALSVAMLWLTFRVKGVLKGALGALVPVGGVGE
jgi:serine/threonine protein kinase